jgi:zeta-carotene desaturase
MKVIVVGAGLAGLTAAADLVDAGAEVCVLEKRHVPGGKVSSWSQGQLMVESGLHVFFGCYRELLGMMRRVGAYDHILWKEHKIYVAHPGGKVSTFNFPNLPAPLNGIVAFSTNDLLTWREKLTNIRALLRPWLHSLERVAEWDDRTYTEWHSDYGIDQGVLTKWWNPIALSMGFLDAREMSARPMTTVFHHFSRSAGASRVGFLDGPPNERLHRPFIEYIEQRGGKIRLGAKVARFAIEWPDAPSSLQEFISLIPRVAAVELESGERLEADAFVVATPLHNARRIIPSELQEVPYFANLWKLSSVPAMNVQVWFDRYVSDTDNLFFTADAPFSVFADLTRTSPMYDRTGGSLVSMTVAPAEPLWRLPDDEIAQRCIEALRKLWPRARNARITQNRVIKIPNSIYREVPGSDALRPTQRTPIPNLALAGDYTQQDYMASMEGAVRSGHLAARALLACMPDMTGKDVRIDPDVFSVARR